MAEVPVTVLRVFCDEDDRHGNPLGVIDGTLVPGDLRQGVAAELGYSETVYVDDPAAGVIQIFTPTRELPFAGHPTVGTSWWLRRNGYDVTVLRVPAGDVQVRFDGDTTRVRGNAEWASRFEWHDLASPADVEALEPGAFEGGPHYAWAWIDEPAGRVRSRMFGPGIGIAEDEATGAAAVAFTVRMKRDLEITQGGGSRLSTTYEGDTWATVGGRTVLDGDRTIVR